MMLPPFGGYDFPEGADAFREKRGPHLQGRSPGVLHAATPDQR